MSYRVLMVHYFDPATGGGGAERLLEDERDSLLARGHDVRLFHGGDLCRVLDDFAPDVVHMGTIHIADPDLTWALTCYQHGVPVVWHLHDYWPFCPTRMLLSSGDCSCSAVGGVCADECGCRCDLQRTAAAGFPWQASYPGIVNAGYVTVSNQRTAQIMRTNGIRVDRVVPLGVNASLFYPATEPRNPHDIYTSSAWAAHPTKGMHVLRQACAGADWGVKVLTGLRRERVAEHLRRASIYIFPSCYEETWGLCLTEAMMSGCACIATDVAGAVDQIEHGVTGIIVPKRDARAITGAVEYLLEDASARTAMQTAASKRALGQYTADAMAVRWEATYADAIARATHGTP